MCAALRFRQRPYTSVLCYMNQPSEISARNSETTGQARTSSGTVTHIPTVKVSRKTARQTSSWMTSGRANVETKHNAGRVFQASRRAVGGEVERRQRARQGAGPTAEERRLDFGEVAVAYDGCRADDLRWLIDQTHSTCVPGSLESASNKKTGSMDLYALCRKLIPQTKPFSMLVKTFRSRQDGCSKTVEQMVTRRASSP